MTGLSQKDSLGNYSKAPKKNKYFLFLEATFSHKNVTIIRIDKEMKIMCLKRIGITVC